MLDPADAQPAGLALQIGLTELWRARGVSPAAVVGHSFGEVAAAWAAGALTLEQAFEIATHRSRLEQTLVGRGGMVAVTSPELSPGVELAAVNGPHSFTLTGDVEAIEGTRLRVSIPYHSAHADQLRERFDAAVGHIRARAPRFPFFSTVAGARVTDPGYWWRNLREPTRFDAALRRMRHLRTFVEARPAPGADRTDRRVRPRRGRRRDMRRKRGSRRVRGGGRQLREQRGEARAQVVLDPRELRVGADGRDRGGQERVPARERLGRVVLGEHREGGVELGEDAGAQERDGASGKRTRLAEDVADEQAGAIPLGVGGGVGHFVSSAGAA